jgi:hypothetical protein
MSNGVRGAAGRLRGDAIVALPSWLTARAVVLGALAFAHFLFNHLHVRMRTPVHQGLLAWDADWYSRIAKHGYAGVPRTGLRFFPLYPLLGRVLAPVFGGMVEVALLVLANAPALLLGALLVRLVRREGGDGPAADRATWFVALVPSAFVLVFAYSEAIAGCLAVAMFLALRSRRWWWAAAAGFLSGLTRPSGSLLAVPALVEAVRGIRGGHLSGTDAAARLAAVVAPVAGVGAYLGWVGLRFGTPLLPVTIQQRSFLRGGFVNPVVAFFHAGRDAFNGNFGVNGLHFPGLVVIAALVVVVCLRWPASYGAYAVVTFLVALSARRLGSVERYCFSAFPIVLALVSLTRSRRVEMGVLVSSGVWMAGFATLAFLGLYVP